MQPLGPIVDAGDLGRLDAVLCDVRWYLDGRSGREAYEAGHLPGAVFVDLDRDLTAPPSTTQGRHPLPTAEAFAAGDPYAKAGLFGQVTIKRWRPVFGV